MSDFHHELGHVTANSWRPCAKPAAPSHGSRKRGSRLSRYGLALLADSWWAFLLRTQGVPLLEVQARWGYSELVDSPASRHYSGLDHLVAKRLSGISFEELSEAEQYELAFGT